MVEVGIAGTKLRNRCSIYGTKEVCQPLWDQNRKTYCPPQSLIPGYSGTNGIIPRRKELSCWLGTLPLLLCVRILNIHNKTSQCNRAIFSQPRAYCFHVCSNPKLNRPVVSIIKDWAEGFSEHTAPLACLLLTWVKAHLGREREKERE